MSEKLINHNECGGIVEAPCKTVVCQKESVSVPVSVNPFVELGKVKIRCCGEPIIHSKNYGSGKCCQESCSFVITQNMTVEIPMEFGTRVKMDDAIVQCETITKEACN